ncbi:DUF6492 family protein [Rathayibacter sp. YIM 133350]|uniref:DUF6492 family protein n=1 Tax=Rathayibacter sp. YIM 133350 TaxID=3131992 RepID=UPI00307F42BF
MTSATMTVITPSYRPDRGLCADLAASVLAFSDESVNHRIVVPRRDLPAFASLSGTRTSVADAADYLPTTFLRVPGNNFWVNARHPLPPIRGWIAQQIVKIQAVADCTADLALLADSDLEFVAPFSTQTFMAGSAVPLYRLAGGVTPDLPRHRVWHSVARRLLGLEPTDSTTLPDYICWPCIWQPALVRSMLARIEEVTAAPWSTAIGRELHFSEMILYGVYVEEIVGRQQAPVFTDDMHCIVQPDEVAFDADSMRRFLGTVGPNDVAVMVSARSGTPLDVRRSVMAERAGQT